MRVVPFIILAVMGSACGVTTEVVVLNPAAPAYTPVSPDSVHIFANSNSVLIDYEAIATISAGSSASGVIAPDEADMLTALRETAGGLGADALILWELLDQRPSGSADGLLPARGRGTAIRLRDDSAQEPSLKAAARPIEGIRTIALSPVIRGDGLPMPDTIRWLFEQDVRATLLAHGFSTVSEAVSDSVRTAHILDVGGLFDPVTGHRYDDRAMLVERRTRQTLIDEHGVDGFLVQEIWTVPVFYSRKEAKWDGTRQRLSLPEDDGIACPAGDPDSCEGVLRALSFMVRLENSFGAMLYTGRGGIELLELLDNRGQPYPLPPHPFAKAGRIREAVALALAQLVQDDGGGRPGPI